MKYLLLIVSAYFILQGCKEPIDRGRAEKQLRSILEQKEFFKLETRLKAWSNDLDDQQKLYFRAFVDNAFNRNEDCVKDIDTLLKTHESALTDSNKYILKRLQSDSYFKLYQYGKAAKSDSTLLKQHWQSLSKGDVDDIKNDILMRNALKDISPQQTIIKDNTTMQWTRDKLGLINIPVKTNGPTYSAIFDTRANISSVSQTYARKLGLRILNVTYNEGSGATGIQFKTGLGIADSLYAGDILVKNVVFQVMPDSILYIAPVKFQINIIIGFPVIEQLQEVHIYRDGRMTIPLRPTQSDLHNFALNGLDPVIALRNGKDTLAFNFDSGASSSVFYLAYFDKYKADVIKMGIKKVVSFGGAGGAQKKEVYVLPKLNLALGDKTVTIDSVSVLTKKIVQNEKFYGNIGQDLTNQFNEVVYNFKYMYIKGK